MITPHWEDSKGLKNLENRQGPQTLGDSESLASPVSAALISATHSLGR